VLIFHYLRQLGTKKLLSVSKILTLFISSKLPILIGKGP
jgi:hypothetical protein